MSKTQKKVGKTRRGRAPRDPVLESLSARKMSVFLLESSAADLNEEIRMKSDVEPGQNVVKNLGEALKFADKELKALDDLGSKLKSESIAAVVKEITGNLNKIQIGNAKESDGRKFKQVAYVVNGISQARTHIKTAVTTTIEVLQRLKVNLEEDNEKPIGALEVFTPGTKDYGGIRLDEFQKGLVKKIKGGLLKRMSDKLFGDVKAININAEGLASEITNLTGAQLKAVAEMDIVKKAGGDNPTEAERIVKGVREDIKSSSSSTEGAEANGKDATAPATPGDRKLSSIESVREDDAEAALRNLLGDNYDEYIKKSSRTPEGILSQFKAVKKYVDLLKKMDVKLETHVSRGDLLLERLNVLAGTSNHQTNRRDK